MILLVLLQVLRQMIDALRKQRDLHISRARVPFVEFKIAYRFRLCFHTFQFSNNSKSIRFSISRQSVLFVTTGVKDFPDAWPEAQRRSLYGPMSRDRADLEVCAPINQA